MKISIAIPDSCLSDESTQLNKSRKISNIARAASIFRVDTIFVYNDNAEKNDRILLMTVLKYLNTPPFLRKRLFPKINELKYAGVLHPIKISSHVMSSNPKKIKEGDIREAVVVISKGKKFVDVGINSLISYYGKEQVGSKITIQFKKGFPDLSIKDISKEQISDYWGYAVKERSNLAGILSSWSGKIILTSRKGKNLNVSHTEKYFNSNEPTIVVFGSVDKGIHQILGGKIKQIQNSHVINFFPHQGTETVRFEESLLGVLSILNTL